MRQRVGYKRDDDRSSGSLCMSLQGSNGIHTHMVYIERWRPGRWQPPGDDRRERVFCIAEEAEMGATRAARRRSPSLARPRPRADHVVANAKTDIRGVCTAHRVECSHRVESHECIVSILYVL